MKMTPKESTISSILSIKNREYEIPRFQREYSWEKKQYKEFLEDMISNIIVSDEELQPTPYFMGTMLFVGDKDRPGKDPVFVVDGQQRLTTITILFSAIANLFQQLGNTVLRDSIFSYIMSKTNDGEQIRVLKTVSSYPYFSYYIQSLDKSNANIPTSEEDENIKATYDFFEKILQEKSLRELFGKKGKDTHSFSHVDLLKAIREQVLSSTVIEIITEDRKVANALFEILNAKGKGLSNVDMIKNKIFEVLDTVEPADYASDKWNAINEILDSCNEGVGFATFLRHYFSSKYKSISKANLYDKFKELIKKTRQEYSLFLSDLEAKARIYKKIVVPQRQDYANRKEYFWLVQSLEVFNKVFNIVNIRVPLMALIDAKERGAITMKQLKDIVLYMENFHFAYTALLSKGTNRVDKHYSAFAIKLSKSKNSQETKLAIDELKKVIEPIFPSFEDFYNKFILLSYSKADNPSNMKTRYAIKKLNCFYSESEVFDDNGSIEHILPESNELSLNIGNLIWLELNINNKAKDYSYLTKKEYYARSKYDWVQNFVKYHEDWNEDEITDRAKQLARTYYEKIFDRIIE